MMPTTVSSSSSSRGPKIMTMPEVIDYLEGYAHASAAPNDIVTAATAAADAFLKVYATAPDAGEVMLDGRPITRLPLFQRGRPGALAAHCSTGAAGETSNGPPSCGRAGGT